MTLETDPRKLNRFMLKCKPRKQRRTFLHALSGEQRETSCVILILEDNDQMRHFLSAWMPKEQQVEGSHVEVLVDIGYPYDLTQRRIAVMPPDRHYALNPYLLVMDEEMEKLLENRKETVYLHTWPDGVDQQLTMESGS
jgi:hypothetical protein